MGSGSLRELLALSHPVAAVMNERILKDKMQDHAAALTVFFMFNFCRVDQLLSVTPAKGVGVSDHAWALGEKVGEKVGQKGKKHHPYKKRAVD